jgi:hypothetical protein
MDILLRDGRRIRRVARRDVPPDRAKRVPGPIINGKKWHPRSPDDTVVVVSEQPRLEDIIVLSQRRARARARRARLLTKIFSPPIRIFLFVGINIIMKRSRHKLA